VQKQLSDYPARLLRQMAVGQDCGAISYTL
jgi:hypothetical protein